MGIVNRALLKFDIEEVRFKHELHLLFFRLGRKIKKCLKIVNIGYYSDSTRQENGKIN
jgi:hypothetical protein